MSYLEDLDVFLGEIYQSGFKEGARERIKEPPYKCSQCGARIWYRPDDGLCPECRFAPNEGLSLKEKVEELTKELDNSYGYQVYLKNVITKKSTELMEVGDAIGYHPGSTYKDLVGFAKDVAEEALKYREGSTGDDRYDTGRQDERKDWNAWLCLTHELEAPLDAEAGAGKLLERAKQSSSIEIAKAIVDAAVEYRNSHPEKFKS
jgi:hypothetical protein